MNNKQSLDLSVIVTAHSEGILLHKTLKSIDRAGALLTSEEFSYEVLIHIDSPNADTVAYLESNKDYLSKFTLYTNDFKDAGAARNFCVKKSQGTYVTFIDGDDLVSKHWLLKALKYLTEHSDEDVVAHSELTVEFGDSNSIVQKHGEIDRYSDSILSVYANRWNAVLMTKRKILLQEPYAVDPDGYGFEDWHLNTRLIYRDYHNVLIPETVIFVRRKVTDSRWASHRSARAVLHANPLLGFEHIRSLVPPADKQPSATVAPTDKPLAAAGKQLLQKHPRLYNAARRYYLQLKAPAAPQPSTHSIPAWLLEEWRDIHTIEKLLFPSEDVLARTQTYDSITPVHWKAGQAYKRVVDALANNAYDYIIFAPWLIKGGADKFVIEYANQIQASRPDKRVLVIATLSTESPWEGKLAADFLPFGKLTASLDADTQMRVLEQLIENSGAQYLHIINSALGYDFVRTHATYIKGSGKHVVATSFSQSTDASGRIFGYSHTHVPDVYNLCEYLTSDNQTVLDMWHSEYGFDKSKLLLHRPLIEVDTTTRERAAWKAGEPMRVLWAARLAPEKLPHLVADIARIIPSQDITIDMYGGIDEGFDSSFIKNLPANVTYKGSYDGFFSLPLADYDAFLYTSLFDGMPNVLLEAGSVKLPIIASAAGGIPELIKDRETGLLIQDIFNAQAYADALQALYADKTLRGSVSTSLHELLVAEYSEDAYHKRVMDMLKNISY